MKAIAIIKKPYVNLCMGCPFCKGDDVRLCVCTLLGNKSLMEVDEYIDKDCPLKPMPSKYKLTTEKGNRYAVGYNDCIDEILGEQK